LPLLEGHKGFEQVHYILAGVQGAGKYKVFAAIGVLALCGFALVVAQGAVFFVRAIVYHIYLPGGYAIALAYVFFGESRNGG
jgi:hypothetical protein